MGRHKSGVTLAIVSIFLWFFILFFWYLPSSRSDSIYATFIFLSITLFLILLIGIIVASAPRRRRIRRR